MAMAAMRVCSARGLGGRRSNGRGFRSRKWPVHARTAIFGLKRSSKLGDGLYLPAERRRVPVGRRRRRETQVLCFLCKTEVQIR
jgi:hypothetical protein